MNRIIIAISILNRMNWSYIYQFIRCIVTPSEIYNRHDCYAKISSVASVRLSLGVNKNDSYDVFALEGENLTNECLEAITSTTFFSIIYCKKDDTEDFTELVPFVLLQHEFGEILSLGIDIDHLNLNRQKAYKFKISNFFILFDDRKPKCGNRSLYLINEKTIDENTGAVEYISASRVSSLAGKSIFSKEKYRGQASRRYLPLLHITDKNYYSIFGTDTIFCTDNPGASSYEYGFIKDSIAKIRKTYSVDRLFVRRPSEPSVHYETLFGQWLLSGFLFSYSKKELKKITTEDLSSIRRIIKVYENSVFELVQNIIFHGGGEGIVYCVFDKKKNIPSYYSEKIPEFSKYADETRFLRIGVLDFNENGVADTYNGRLDLLKGGEKLSLIDFYNTESFATMDLTKLELRHAARLGIKTFVKTIFKHGGCFRVESNDTADGRNTKKVIQSQLTEGNNRELVEGDSIFANGTHYEVVMPVVPTREDVSKNSPLQRSSILESLYNGFQQNDKKGQQLKAVSVPVDSIIGINNSESKEHQIQRIIEVACQIRNRCTYLKSFEKTSAIALDLNENYVDPKVLFKILAYLQLHDDLGYDRIYIVNAQDSFLSDFCDLINPLVVYGNGEEVWSRSSAIILVSINLHVQIIWGKSKEELYYINNEIQRYYCNYFYAPRGRWMFHEGNVEVEEDIKKIADRMIAPYDIIVSSEKGNTVFEEFLGRLLKRNIISRDFGCLVNHENTYIGNKIIVKNYYEADILFQNNFFTERFAYLISNSIRNELKVLRSANGTHKKLVLIGYKRYSEFLLKTVKRILSEEKVSIVIANEEQELFDTADENKEQDLPELEKFFDFSVDNDGDSFITDFLNKSEDYQIATLVPIGSTLSTNDKIIAFFKQWYKYEHKKHQLEGAPKVLADSQFIYNHCVIVVRNSTDANPTKLELEQGWKKNGVSLTDRTIETNYNNSHKVHFNLQIARAISSGDGGNNWERKLNDDFSFPHNWWNERYVNYTENASINSQNLMGFPQAMTSDETVHSSELMRFYEFRNDICKGHIDLYGCHHKYYIDTESFVKRNNSGLIKWLKDIGKDTNNEAIFNRQKLNVIVTPDTERETDYVRIVNEYLFDGTAMIVCLDVRNWRNNIVHKLSFLKDITSDNVRYHYVDHALLSGNTYHKTKSYLFSILNVEDLRFESVVTIVNRLPFSKTKEIKNDIGENIFAYVNLFYPSNEGEQGCELCKLLDYYKNLSGRTVLESCVDVVNKNTQKLTVETKISYPSQKTIQKKRSFLRMVMTHELYYRIARAVQLKEKDGADYEEMSRQVEKTLNSIYSHFSAVDNMEMEFEGTVTLNAVIDSWFRKDFVVNQGKLYDYYVRKLNTDKKISFLKVISSPPLSQYISIRKYAYEKLLSELHVIINKPSSECCYDDLKTIKSILKSLSFLKSNVLVRKNVLTGIWFLLSHVVDNLSKERDELKKLQKMLKYQNYLINKAIKDARTTEQGELFRDNVDILGVKRQLLMNCREELKEDLGKVSDEKRVVQDFSRDVQFFVKNAIVDDEAKATYLGELLRQGKEMAEFGNIMISATSLYLAEENEKNRKSILAQTKQKVGNALFGELSSVSNVMIKKEYIKFLVWLFYDNTTIIQKTLDNFAWELKKDSDCYSLFYVINEESKKQRGKKTNNNDELKNIKVFKSGIDQTREFFENKIKDEYYYRSFRPYLNNGDKIDYVEKLLYVTYAKLKLKGLTSQYHKTLIETDTRDLMESFAAIMGADAAFWTMNQSGRLYPVSLYGKVDQDHCEDTWDYDRWLLNDNFYTGRFHIYKRNKEIKAPIIPIYDVKQDMGEFELLKAKSIGIFVITNPDNVKEGEEIIEGVGKGTMVASITFLYKKDNPNVKDERAFRINLQESGRLLLLLKNEIDKYVIDYLIKEKTFDLWERKFWHVRRFEKIYANSAHIFKAVYDEMDEFDNMELEVVKKMSNTWYFLSNETISFLYSNIEKSEGGAGKPHVMSLLPKFVIDKGNTIGNTFNDIFIGILSALLRSSRWQNSSGLYNAIYINGKHIDEFSISEELRNIPLRCNKHLMRTFVAQCLHNSLSSVSRHGHRGEAETKRVDVTINYTSICIKDNALNNYYPKEVLKERSSQFRKKRKWIKGMKCEEYSSTTLTSLQGFVNYMNDKNYRFGCDFDFDENNNFFVEIIFR